MKQTAVDWFNQQIVDKQNGKGNSRSWDEILEQANEMFEQQIIDAHNQRSDINVTGESYFNKTYFKNNWKKSC